MNEKNVTLKVAEALQNDIGRGIVRVDSKIKRDLDLATGDFVKLSGKKSTIAVVWQSHPEDEGLDLVRMDGIIRQNTGIGLGDKVKIEKVDVKEAKKLVLSPKEAMRYSPGFDQYVKRKLIGKGMLKGNILPVGVFGTAIPLVVSQVIPQAAVVVTENTDVVVKNEPLKELENVPSVTYDDVGGMQGTIQKIREIVELPLRHPELFERLGIEPPKGVLLHGAPGTGKTLLAKAVANESDANFFHIGGPEVVSKFVGESEEKIRKIFKEAEESAPSIIFIDEIDAIAPKRGEVTGEVERRMVSQLLTLMDGLKSRGQVIVIAATNRPDAIDEALRRPGRFDREIEISVPDREGRREILQIHTRNMPLNKNVNIKELANVSHGYTGADLSSLTKEAALKSLRRILPEINPEDEFIPPEILDRITVTQDDFFDALREIQPSALRELYVERPNVKWEEVGGLEPVKRDIREAVELPLKKPEVFEQMGIRPIKGILLYGPPGTGKTLLARAAATESEANFIAINGPAILSKWVGESLAYDEEFLFFDANNTPRRMMIGEYVDSIINSNANKNGDGIQISSVAQQHEVFSFDENGGITFSPVSDALRHPFVASYLYEIETKTGRKIRLTKDHGLFTLWNDEIIETKTSELVPLKNYVAIPARLEFPANPVTKISLEKLTKHKYHKVVDGKIFVANNRKVMVPIELKITPELMYIIGLWLAEGDYNNGIRIHNQNLEVRERLRKCAEKLGMPYFENSKFLLITSLLWQRIFEDVIGLKSGAFNKRFPALAFGLPKTTLAWMLSGYFSGDGSVHGNSHRHYIEGATVSERMADDIQTLLLYFGIVATKYTKDEKGYNHPKYVVQFSGVDNFRKFLDISFTDRKRAERVSNYILSKKWSRTKQIPLSDGLKKFLYMNGHHEWVKAETVGSRILERVLRSADPERKTRYWKLIEDDLYWDKVAAVRRIKYDKPYVYDLSVNNTERFFASGFFVHNSEKALRELFKKARQAAPSVIFIDELDAVAPRRGGSGEGNMVTERVVDTLLTEMDGLRSLKNVVVIAATNRPDILDVALLRAGRFDKMIEIPIPDTAARYEILKIHAKKMPLERVDLRDIAAGTEGFTGADLENLVREAGMIAIREGAKKVSQLHFGKALKTIIPGVKKDDLESMKKFKSAAQEMYR